ncbi:larval/pupal rigid cuticle protein 66-like [Amyelois transitella]|uniref:larval/pupal rigid cuticle protein 66-like n=1 Tax=Amyelois transitella TaxID=680683 RepID=UPI00067C06F8|nr:larval/pupal rigid cuticle protein 66-like [Amyelois transitella]
MFAKFVPILALVAVAAASTSDFTSFSYGVADPFTGDFKQQVESRAGDNVNGQYSLIEPDGTRRTVDYAAGSEGFNAVVKKDPAVIAAPIIAAKTIAPVFSYPYAPYFAKFGYPYAYARYY